MFHTCLLAYITHRCTFSCTCIHHTQVYFPAGHDQTVSLSDEGGRDEGSSSYNDSFIAEIFSEEVMTIRFFISPCTLL